MKVFYIYEENPELNNLGSDVEVIPINYKDCTDIGIAACVQHPSFRELTKEFTEEIFVVCLYEGETLTEKNWTVLRNISQSPSVMGAMIYTGMGLEARALRCSKPETEQVLESLCLGTCPDPVGCLVEEGKPSLHRRILVEMYTKLYADANTPEDDRVRSALCMSKLSEDPIYWIVRASEFRIKGVECAFAFLCLGKEETWPVATRVEMLFTSLEMYPLQAAAHYHLALLARQNLDWEAVLGHAAAASGVGVLTRNQKSLLSDADADWSGPLDLSIEAAPEVMGPAAAAYVRGFSEARARLEAARR